MIVLKNYYWIDAVHWNDIPLSVRNKPTEKLLVIKSSLSVLLFSELISATTYQLFIHYVLTLSSLVQVFLKKRCSRNQSPSRLPVSPMYNVLQRVQVMQ